MEFVYKRPEKKCQGGLGFETGTWSVLLCPMVTAETLDSVWSNIGLSKLCLYIHYILGIGETQIVRLNPVSFRCVKV